MRAVLVGTPAERARLRSGIDGSIEIVGEYGTLSEARRSAVPPDVILLAPAGAAEPADDDPAPGEELTRRETQVLELLAEGLPNKAIASRLGISDQTVKFHVASIASKLGATNRTDAVRLALRRGLIAL
jgi:DNA-binding NarL/FixJ family response regulator